MQMVTLAPSEHPPQDAIPFQHHSHPGRQVLFQLPFYQRGTCLSEVQGGTVNIKQGQVSSSGVCSLNNYSELIIKMRLLFTLFYS